jgi:predicted AlkP superfamily pyrophosphatase or phosphodiesterase
MSAINGIRWCFVVAQLSFAMVGFTQGGKGCSESERAVVKISSNSTGTMPERTLGAGILVSRSEAAVYILTAYHVVKNDPSVVVRLCEDQATRHIGKRFTKWSEEQELDLAVIVVSDFTQQQAEQIPLSLGINNEPGVEAGDLIDTIGHHGDDDWKVVRGINHVTRLDRAGDDRIFKFTQIAVGDGNSGGPALDAHGNIAGVVIESVQSGGEAAAVRIRYAIGLLTTWGIPSELLTNSALKPKLVLLVILSQCRYDYLVKYRSYLTGGIGRLLSRGAVFSNTHHDHFPTRTSSGLSVITTGADPSLNGVVADEWVDFARSTDRPVTSVDDAETQLLGQKEQSDGSATSLGSSPRQVFATTIGDELRSNDPRSKVFSVGQNDRSAIIPGGTSANAVYWLAHDEIRFVSSTFYMEDVPQWVKTFNDKEKNAAYLRGLYTDGSEADDHKNGPIRLKQPFFGIPLADRYMTNFIKELVDKEHIGTLESPDLLTVTFYSVHSAGHRAGPDSEDVKEALKEVDNDLDDLFHFLDRMIGLPNVLVVLTSEHGVAPSPTTGKYLRARGGFVDGEDLGKKINAHLNANHLDEKQDRTRPFVLFSLKSSIYLNRGVLASANISIQEAEREAAEVLQHEKGVFRVYTASDLTQTVGGASDPITRRVLNGFFPGRSGDVIYVLAPGFVDPPGGPNGVSPSDEGSPYEYDTHVPLIFMGSQIRAGLFVQSALANDIAPTLAALLGIEAPTASTGRILVEAIR